MELRLLLHWAYCSSYEFCHCLKKHSGIRSYHFFCRSITSELFASTANILFISTPLIKLSLICKNKIFLNEIKRQNPSKVRLINAIIICNNGLKKKKKKKLFKTRFYFSKSVSFVYNTTSKPVKLL